MATWKKTLKWKIDCMFIIPGRLSMKIIEWTWMMNLVDVCIRGIVKDHCKYFVKFIVIFIYHCDMEWIYLCNNDAVHCFLVALKGSSSVLCCCTSLFRDWLFEFDFFSSFCKNIIRSLKFGMVSKCKLILDINKITIW